MDRLDRLCGLVLIIFCLFLGVSSCRSLSPTTNQTSVTKEIEAPTDFLRSEVKQLTFVGQNFHPRFSPNGQRISYLSSNRHRHKNSQVYMLTLATGAEKRMTFHDGENTGAFFSKNGQHLVYASTTDEIKENPTFLKQSLPALQELEPEVSLPNLDAPTELYTTDLNGYKIKRLTKTPNFDGDANLDPRTERIVFSSVRDGNFELYSLEPGSGKVHRLTRNTETTDRHPSFSSNGRKLTWVKHSKDGPYQLVVGNSVARQPKVIYESKHIIDGPQWQSKGEWILFSSKDESTQQYEILAAHLSGQCVRRLTYHQANDRHPAFSPDGRQIAFTSDRQGKDQVFLMSFIEPKPCASAAL